MTPPRAGPAMAPVWKAMDWAAMAGGRALRPTTIGRKAWLAGARKARAAPKTAATASRPHRGGEPCSAIIRKALAHIPSTMIDRVTVCLRSCRSAMAPAGRVKASSGRNWHRPTSPR